MGWDSTGAPQTVLVCYQLPVRANGHDTGRSVHVQPQLYVCTLTCWLFTFSRPRSRMNWRRRSRSVRRAL